MPRDREGLRRAAGRRTPRRRAVGTAGPEHRPDLAPPLLPRPEQGSDDGRRRSGLVEGRPPGSDAGQRCLRVVHGARRPATGGGRRGALHRPAAQPGRPPDAAEARWRRRRARSRRLRRQGPPAPRCRTPPALVQRLERASGSPPDRVGAGAAREPGALSPVLSPALQTVRPSGRPPSAPCPLCRGSTRSSRRGSGSSGAGPSTPPCRWRGSGSGSGPRSGRRCRWPRTRSA